MKQLVLEENISNFLAATALWNTQWFNKPKFHLFVHLVNHIRRFGPAVLYATEGFESYNLVIRLRSINSNRHAPSRDIARAFSHLHAVRHLSSGGFVTKDLDGLTIPPRQSGVGVRALADDPEFLKFMCMGEFGKSTPAGRYTLMQGEGVLSISDTITFQKKIRGLSKMTSTVRRCSALWLDAEREKLSISSFVLYNIKDRTAVGQVKEMLIDDVQKRIIGLLLHEFIVGDAVMPYRFPSVTATADSYHFVSFNVCMIFHAILYNSHVPTGFNMLPQRTP